MAISKSPSFNIKVVLRETGLKADALRVWEKRYGLPSPARSEGGHRLYSEYDIAVVKWLLSKKDEGLSIGKAVALFNDLVEKNENPLDIQEGAGAGLIISGRQLDEIRSEFVRACQNFNEALADSLLTQAFAMYPAENVAGEVMQKGLTEIGEAWFENELTIAQEHFASNLIIRKLNAILSASPAPTRSEKILIANPKKEQHIFSGLMIALMLRNRGWQVIQLGADVPSTQALSAVKSTQSKAAILIAMQLMTAANLLDMAIALQEAGIAVGYGGLAFQRFPSLIERIPGFYLGEDLLKIGEEVENLVKSSSNERHVDISPLKDLEISFLEKRGQINSDLLADFGDDQATQSFIAIANEQFGEDIWAAAHLGDLELLNQEIDWVRELIGKRNAPIHLLVNYLSTYKEKVEQHMGHEGAPLSEWLITGIESIGR